MSDLPSSGESPSESLQVEDMTESEAKAGEGTSDDPAQSQIPDLDNEQDQDQDQERWSTGVYLLHATYLTALTNNSINLVWRPSHGL